VQNIDYLKTMLSRTSKMPCDSIGLPAWECITGGKLSKINGSTCYKCYAMQGMYRMPNVKNKNYERLDFFNSKEFIPAMVLILNNKKNKLFRWFDSGDVQSVIMALNILTICDETPNIKHWIASRESKIWKAVKKIRSIPENVCLRISATMIDQKPSNIFNNTSTVNSQYNKNIIGKECQAFRTLKNGKMIPLNKYLKLKKEKQLSKYNLGNCGHCQDCWKVTIKNISYPLH
jgi:hypothetical protein